MSKRVYTIPLHKTKQKGQAHISELALFSAYVFWWGDTPTSPNLLRGATAARSVLKSICGKVCRCVCVLSVKENAEDQFLNNEDLPF